MDTQLAVTLQVWVRTNAIYFVFVFSGKQNNHPKNTSSNCSKHTGEWVWATAYLPHFLFSSEAHGMNLYSSLTRLKDIWCTYSSASMIGKRSECQFKTFHKYFFFTLKACSHRTHPIIAFALSE